MQQTFRYNTVNDGKDLVTRFNISGGDYPILQVWERLENFNELIPLVWELKQKELAREKAAEERHKAELKQELALVDSWRDNKILRVDDSGETARIDGEDCRLLRTESGDAENGGFRVYVSRRLRAVYAYICWEFVTSLEQYNEAMRALQSLQWRMERG